MSASCAYLVEEAPPPPPLSPVGAGRGRADPGPQGGAGGAPPGAVRGGGGRSGRRPQTGLGAGTRAGRRRVRVPAGGPGSLSPSPSSSDRTVSGGERGPASGGGREAVRRAGGRGEPGVGPARTCGGVGE